MERRGFNSSAALLAYFLLYLLVAMVWRSALVWRSTGVNPFVLPFDDSAYGYVGRAMRHVIGAMFLLVVCAAVAPELLKWLGPLIHLHHLGVVLVGWGMLWGSLVWIAVAQANMGASWRIGIDHNRPTALVQRGLFRWSRNPIFLGMRVSLLGFFLVLPNAVTLSVLLVGEVLMHVQVRLEESHLRNLCGAQYDTYCAQVRRWL